MTQSFPWSEGSSQGGFQNQQLNLDPELDFLGFSQYPEPKLAPPQQGRQTNLSSSRIQSATSAESFSHAQNTLQALGLPSNQFSSSASSPASLQKPRSSQRPPTAPQVQQTPDFLQGQSFEVEKGSKGNPTIVTMVTPVFHGPVNIPPRAEGWSICFSEDSKEPDCVISGPDQFVNMFEPTFLGGINFLGDLPASAYASVPKVPIEAPAKFREGATEEVQKPISPPTQRVAAQEPPRSVTPAQKKAAGEVLKPVTPAQTSVKGLYDLTPPSRKRAAEDEFQETQTKKQKTAESSQPVVRPPTPAVPAFVEIPRLPTPITPPSMEGNTPLTTSPLNTALSKQAAPSNAAPKQTPPTTTKLLPSPVSTPVDSNLPANHEAISPPSDSNSYIDLYSEFLGPFSPSSKPTYIASPLTRYSDLHVPFGSSGSDKNTKTDEPPIVYSATDPMSTRWAHHPPLPDHMLPKLDPNFPEGWDQAKEDELRGPWVDVDYSYGVKKWWEE